MFLLIFVVAVLKLSIKGEANVRWTEQMSTRDANGNHTTTTVSYTGNEKYFSLTISLLEKSKGYYQLKNQA